MGELRINRSAMFAILALAGTAGHRAVATELRKASVFQCSPVNAVFIERFGDEAAKISNPNLDSIPSLIISIGPSRKDARIARSNGKLKTADATVSLNSASGSLDLRDDLDDQITLVQTKSGMVRGILASYVGSTADSSMDALLLASIQLLDCEVIR